MRLSTAWTCTCTGEKRLDWGVNEFGIVGVGASGQIKRTRTMSISGASMQMPCLIATKDSTLHLVVLWIALRSESGDDHLKDKYTVGGMSHPS